MNFVVDASALLAVILEEPGADTAFSLMRDSEMSAINLSEVYAKLISQGVTLPDAQGQAARFELTICEFGELHAAKTAALRPFTRHLGLSFGDRACLAQAELSNLPVLTADKEWAKLDLGIDIRLIR